jgi:hypothetical protein
VGLGALSDAGYSIGRDAMANRFVLTRGNQALAFMSADAIVCRYKKSPGALL